MERLTTVPLLKPILPPSHIDIHSPFTPSEYTCCQCDYNDHDLVFVKGGPTTPCPHLHDPRACFPSHAGEAQGCQIRDHLGQPAVGLPTPSVFLCATCKNHHSVFEIMTQERVACGCGAPFLQAVYDQFGTILLWPGPRDDPTIGNLSDPKKVAELKRRLIEIGGIVWLDNEEKVREWFEEQGSLEFWREVEAIERVMKMPKPVPAEWGPLVEMLHSPSLSPSMSPSPSPSSEGEQGWEGILKGTGLELVPKDQMDGGTLETEDSLDVELAPLDVDE
ncbi:hypothetical protein QBC41DRAFT_360143 [Cercophora samala]|uniref:Uncharacterized protein n=1 Tax=Cercophora samala TaxID=330535 RepID=A0AA39YZ54_9PEZI|nr:hypothetical protein QBC41DRAFT_360143 [Cercophora samala]